MVGYRTHYLHFSCSDTLSRLKGIETYLEGKEISIPRFRSDTLSRLKGIETLCQRCLRCTIWCSDTLSRLKGIETGHRVITYNQ